MHRAGAGVEFELTDERPEADLLVERDGFELLVEPGLEGTVDVVEPDQLILRPPATRPGASGTTEVPQDRGLHS